MGGRGQERMGNRVYPRPIRAHSGKVHPFRSHEAARGEPDPRGGAGATIGTHHVEGRRPSMVRVCCRWYEACIRYANAYFPLRRDCALLPFVVFSYPGRSNCNAVRRCARQRDASASQSARRPAARLSDWCGSAAARQAEPRHRDALRGAATRNPAFFRWGLF